MRRSSILLGILSLVIVFGACSDDNNNQIRKADPLELEIDKDFISAFEKNSVRIKISKEELEAGYDEIRWSYDGHWSNGVFAISPTEEDILN